MNINAPLMFILFAVGVAALSLALFGIGIAKAIKNVGGLPNLIQEAQAATQRHPAMNYPAVTPVWQTGTAQVASLVMMAITLALLGSGWFFQQNEFRRTRLLQNESVVTRATVTNKTISSGEDSDTYYIFYAFTAVVDDRPIEVQHKAKAPEYLYERVELGSAIEVIYARSDPRITTLHEMYTPGKISYWPFIALGGSGLICLLITMGCRKQYRHAQQLDDEGQPISSTILDLYTSEDSDSTTYYVGYTLPEVGPVKQSIDKQIYERLHIGGTLHLLYLPDNPKVFRTLWS